MGGPPELPGRRAHARLAGRDARSSPAPCCWWMNCWSCCRRCWPSRCLWWAWYPIERRLHEVALLQRLDRGLPVHLPPGRWPYVLSQLRLHVLLMLVPMLLILAVAEGLGALAGPGGDIPGSDQPVAGGRNRRLGAGGARPVSAGSREPCWACGACRRGRCARTCRPSAIDTACGPATSCSGEPAAR